MESPKTVRRDQFASIPQLIWSYYDELMKKNGPHPLIEATKKQGQEKTWKGIDELFGITSENTSLPPTSLVTQLGFDPKNFDPQYLQAILGNMRSINMLHSIGFRDIQPLPAVMSRRESDLLAMHRGTRFAVEVARSSETAYRFPEHASRRHNLAEYIASRYEDKQAQLGSTMQNRNCSKALFVVVMDSQPAKALLQGHEWEEVAREAFRFMGEPANTRLLIFTGMADSNGRDEYAVHPPL